VRAGGIPNGGVIVPGVVVGGFVVLVLPLPDVVGEEFPQRGIHLRFRIREAGRIELTADNRKVP
jgi:hypothetical protein